MLTILLMAHALIAVALLGGVTHQASTFFRSNRHGGGVVRRFGRVQDSLYTNAIVVFYIVTVAGGALLYPSYTLNVRIALEEMYLLAPMGLFELKEHFGAVGLGILPIYWWLWNTESQEKNKIARKGVTFVILFIVWWNFLVGLFLNNMRGLT
jgi:hypothetical protein